MADPFTILGIAGSLRRDSFNRSLLQHAADCAPDGVVVAIYDGLGTIAHFNEDLEAMAGPPRSSIFVIASTRPTRCSS